METSTIETSTMETITTETITDTHPDISVGLETAGLEKLAGPGSVLTASDVVKHAV